MSNTPATPSLRWDIGPAYDLFISLYVLHKPAMFGLRLLWAAGVRSRLPAPLRDWLEDAVDFHGVPLNWLHVLPEPKTARTALDTLAALPAAGRLPALLSLQDARPEMKTILERIAADRTHTPADVDAIAAMFQHRSNPPKAGAAARLCGAFTRLEETGERLLEALELYHQVFFAEEERRILPHLYAAQQAAQQSAQTLPPDRLVTGLSQGVRFSALPEMQEIILVPSFWSSPLVFYREVAPHITLMIYGARPADVALVPGEQVPEGLVNGLKALADPTRLRILRYLADEPLTPAQLASRLRLRAPTVIHHLRELRLAGLVEITLQADGDRRYTANRGAAEIIFQRLAQFLSASGTAGE